MERKTVWLHHELRRACPLLITRAGTDPAGRRAADPAGRRAADPAGRRAADPAGGRADVSEVDGDPPLPAATLLVRPDGYVAWAGDDAGAAG